MSTITGTRVGFQYRKNQYILENIDFSFKSGEFTAIIGKNGCGKSTLIKLITALLPLSSGCIKIDQFDIGTKEGINRLRNHCGIVFQNPDNQFVSPIVEDDIAFGLENHHIPAAEIPERIFAALSMTGLENYEKRNIASLSGGQKQRAAAAGILAINNEVLIFDEAASMLDPQGKNELLNCIEKLRSQGRTIIMITQNINDVITADKVYVMGNHRILKSGNVRDVLTDFDLLDEAGVQIPFPVRVFHDLNKKGIVLKQCPLTIDELAEELCGLI